MNISEISMLPKIIYILNAVPTKIIISIIFCKSKNSKKLIPKFIQNLKGPQIAKTILTKRNKIQVTLPDFKTYYYTKLHEKKQCGTGINTDIQTSTTEYRVQKWIFTCIVKQFFIRMSRLINGEETIFSTNGPGKIRYPHAREWSWTFYLTPCTKINSK